ncbi:RimJ/RimL family protein N-acetyltransferase [Agromyces terreus]|uniref:RimJ/RimL family protein N-acetyltransferase n=1 Tax=Agromyces terreus TaxID=424795 RepID=A0A9X2KEI8_9MICO|nr:GNAT family N-acetyltransferase [Agromyces terreus]MCP2370677.1 RimJ/RimL family protein N-acetyltransferase [Agromyces terreus]
MADVTLVPWSADDLDLLRRANTPELMDQMGGPENDEQVLARHERYQRLWREATGFQFRIVVPGHPEGVGIVGYWHREHDGEPAFEAGWSVEAAYRGRGIAPAAVQEMFAAARARGDLRPVHAYPRIDNPASNAVCRKAGFTLVGPEEFEIRPGLVLHVNDWVHDLSAPTPGASARSA